MPLAPQDREHSVAAWTPLVLMAAALVLRVLSQHKVVPDAFGNLSPLMAFAFAGSVVSPRRLPWWSWAVLLLLVDWISNGSAWWEQAHGRPEVLLAYGCYALAAWFGSRLRGRAGILDTLTGTLACSVVFYLVTNTFCWWVEPYYAKTMAGLVQALTVGTSGLAPGLAYPTTLEFFRNSLIADLTGAFVLIALYTGEVGARPKSGTVAA